MMVNMSILKNTLEQMASDADDKGEKDFGLRLTVEDAFALCRLQEVVRCKDCKHWQYEYKYCRHLDWYTDKNWFCGDGERKDDAADGV